MTTTYVLGQILGVFAPILTTLSYQANTKRKLLFIQTLATLCICISYLLLDAPSGFALNIVCLTRNVSFFFLNEKSKLNSVAAGGFALMMLPLGILSWQGPISILMITALAINTVCMSFGIPQLLRKSILLTSTMVLIYNCYVFSIGGILNEALAIISSVIGIIRFRKQHKNESVAQAD